MCEQLQYLDGAPPHINNFPKYSFAQDARIVLHGMSIDGTESLFAYFYF